VSVPPYGDVPGEPGQQHYQPYGGPPAHVYAGPPLYAPPQQTNGLAIASMVVSIVALPFCFGLPGIVGAIMGHVARRQVAQRNEQGAGFALAGIIVGWISFALFIAIVVVYAIVIAYAIDDAGSGCQGGGCGSV
jgi:hypothetical protein